MYSLARFSERVGKKLKYEDLMYEPKVMLIPCGQCIGCRIRQREDWTTTFLTTLADTLTSNDVELKDFVKTLTNDVIQNGPSDLSKKSKFMELTADIPPKRSTVSFHHGKYHKEPRP